jgi:hypothetical protein
MRMVSGHLALTVGGISLIIGSLIAVPIRVRKTSASP